MMNSKKTLIILSPGFAAGETDTTCLPSQQQLVSMLAEEFPLINIVVLAFQYPFTDQIYKWKSATVIPFNGKNKGKLYRLWLWIKVWKQLNVIKKQNTVIGLFSFWYGECALTGNLFAKWNGLKHFTWLLGQDARPGNKTAMFLKPKPNELVALSDFIVREFEKNYHVRPAHLVPIGIDERLFAENTGERDIDVLGVGSLIALKRYDVFIDVIKALKNRFPAIRAMVCGKGAEEKKLELMIEQNDLQGSIILAGEKPHAEILQLMQRSKLLLHPSSYEGFGVVCLEALYAGAQVVSFTDPKNAAISNWHIAKDLTHMIELSAHVLQDPFNVHEPVLPYTMKDTARSIMGLFVQSDAAIS